LSRRERVQRWAEQRRQRIEAARNTSQTVEFAFDALSYDTDTGAPVLAAALAFRVFLFQVPYVCVFVILAGYLADLTNREPDSFIRGNGVARLTAQAVSGAADLSGWARVTALFLALYATFLSARAFLKVVNIVHALVWNVPRTRLLRATRASFAFIGLVTLLVGTSIAVSALHSRTALWGIVVLVLYAAAPVAIWWFVSWWLPHRECPRIALAPGALLFAVGIGILHIATVVWFPHHLDSKSDVYGSIGIALALLLWAYLLGRIITLAAVFNTALWARFGADATRPLDVHPPTWRVPLFQRAIDRLWAFFFGNPHVDSDGDER
jgi:membrane protein